MALSGFKTRRLRESAVWKMIKEPVTVMDSKGVDNAIGHYKKEKLKPCMMRADDLSGIKDRVTDISCHSKSANDIVFMNLSTKKCISQSKAIINEQLLIFQQYNSVILHTGMYKTFLINSYLYKTLEDTFCSSVTHLSCYAACNDKCGILFCVLHSSHFHKKFWHKSWSGLINLNFQVRQHSGSERPLFLRAVHLKPELRCHIYEFRKPTCFIRTLIVVNDFPVWFVEIVA